MTNAVKVAVAQIGGANAAELFDKLIIKDVDWYVFDETADIEFELKELRQYYDKVYVGKFEEIK